jgi:NADH:ubiquinone oxidoreductase subunit C
MIEKEQASKKDVISLNLSENGYTYSFLILQNRQSLYAYIRKLFEDTVIIRHDKNELELSTKTSDLIAISNFLRNHTLLNFKQLIEIAVIDRPNKINRFKLNYVLFSPLFNTRIIISTEVKEIDILSSLVKLYKSAEWLEREV